MFANLAIRSKLLTSFGGLLLLTIAISILALVEIGTVNDSAAEIRNVWLPSVDTIGEMKTQTARQRTAATRVVVATEEAARSEAEKLYLKQSGDLVTALTRFEKLGLSPQEQALYGTYQSLRQPYEAAVLKAFEDAKAGRREAAERAMNGEIVQTFRKVQDALEALSSYNRDGAAQAGAVAQQAYGHALWIIWAAAIAAVLLSIGAVLWLDTDLAKQIALLSRLMRQLADRNYKFDLPGRTRTDEVGDMARAIEVFRDSMQHGDALAAAEGVESAAKAARASRIDALVQGFDRDATEALRAVATASGGLQHTAEGLARTAETGARDATTVAGASEQAAANVQTVAAAAEDLGVSINEIGWP